MNARSTRVVKPGLDLHITLFPRDWRQQAACGSCDPEVFFPENGRPSSAYKKVCAECPVLQDCLENVLSSPWEPYGCAAGRSRTELLADWRERHPASQGWYRDQLADLLGRMDGYPGVEAI